MALVTHEDDLAESRKRVIDLLASDRNALEMEKRYVRKNGDVVPGLVHVSVVREDSGQPRYCIAQIIDLTDRRRAEKRLAHQALHDPLTGLPNRALFDSRLLVALNRGDRYRNRLAVMFVDLDNFKVVNDSLGHGVGDELLVAVSSRLVGAVRNVDTVARFGGDEFVVLAEDLTDETQAVMVAQRLLSAFETPFVVAGQELFVGASVGIALSGRDGAVPEDLVRDADVAMYRAKSKGRGRYEVFDDEMRGRAVARLKIENDLRRALDADEFRLFYHPLMSLEDESIVGCEALLRWDHPDRGLVPPDDFIPIAEESGLILPIGEWVLENACRQARRWRSEGKDIAVSVNLAPRQLAQAGLPETVRRILKHTGLPAPALCVEITEGAVIESSQATAASLHGLRKLGVRIAMDDFGTGYSSLGYLRSLPVDVIKLDRAFVNSLPKNREDQAIVSAIMALGNSLGLTVVAEGVETRSQLTELRRLGCRFVQGFYFGKPLPPEDLSLDGFLARSRPGVGDPLVIREFMRQIGIPAKRTA
jgi:diguanylate cyclase (GGDEF)-like protein